MNATPNSQERSESSIDYSVDDGFGVNDSGRSAKRISPRTFVLLGVVLISVVGLWSMRTLSSSAASTPEVDATVRDVREWVWSRSEGGAQTSKAALALIQRLDTSQLDALRVPAEHLRHARPFRPLSVRSNLALSNVVARSTDVGEARSVWNAKVRRIIEGLTISAIMAPGTPRAQAVVDGTRVMVGDEVEVDQLGHDHAYFVTQITHEGVEFEVVHSNGVDRMNSRKAVDRGW